MQKNLFALLLSLFALSLFSSSATATSVPLMAAPKHVALVYVVAGDGKNDGPFIKMARKGAMQAQEDFELTLKEYKLTEHDNVRAAIADIAKSGTSHVVAVGYQNVMPVLSLAERFPQTYFTVIDGLVPPLFHNVQSVMFKDHEGAFLVGMLAALKSKTNHIGFIGGVDIPLIRNFAHGYKQGAIYANPNTNLSVDMIGNDSGGWGNAPRAGELAEQQFDNHVDVVFAAAGAAGINVLKTASQRDDAYAIGVDSNQNSLFPGHILTSMVKRVDKSVYETLRLIDEDRWSSGIKHLGLKEGALDYAVDNDNRALISPEMVEKVTAAREAIVNGTLDVQMYSPR